jgi:hypothetical protein
MLSRRIIDAAAQFIHRDRGKDTECGERQRVQREAAERERERERERETKTMGSTERALFDFSSV